MKRSNLVFMHSSSKCTFQLTSVSKLWFSFISMTFQASPKPCTVVRVGAKSVPNLVRRVLFSAGQPRRPVSGITSKYLCRLVRSTLYEQYDMDVRCYRISLTRNGDDELLAITRAYPPPELTDIAIRRRRRAEGEATGTSNWDEFLKSIENPNEANFVRSEVSLGIENKPDKGTITYRQVKERRYRIWIKQKFAYVIQFGRFEGDDKYWAQRLNSNAAIKPRREGRWLRFRLSTEQDFRAFKDAWKLEISSKPFLATTDDVSDDEAEDQR